MLTTPIFALALQIDLYDLMKRTIIFLISVVILSSCGDRLIYFQKKKESKNTYSNIPVAAEPQMLDHVIEKGDVLQIQLFSSDEILIAKFNQNVLSEEQSIRGYEVNENGTIFIPYAGSVNVMGKNIRDAQKLVKDTLNHYVSVPNMALNLVAFQVIVLGAVNSPGHKTVPAGKSSILDVIALSGDLNDYGNPVDIKVVRDSMGVKTTHFLDISNLDVFSDGCYHIGSNDIIYVETLKRRFIRENLTLLSVVSSFLNIVLLATSRFI